MGYAIVASIYFLVPKQRELYPTCNFLLRVISGTRSTCLARHRSRLDVAPSELTHTPSPWDVHRLGHLSLVIPGNSISERRKKPTTNI